MAKAPNSDEGGASLPPVPPRARKRDRRRVRPIKHGGTVEQRIAHIVGLMREMKFLTGKTGPQLAAKWGLSPETVAEYTAEASRIVRASVIGDREGIGATIGAALDKAIHEATKAKNWRVVAQLADTWAKISGVTVPAKRGDGSDDDAPPPRIEIVLVEPPLSTEAVQSSTGEK